MNCPKCGQEDDGKAGFCWACGERFPEQPKTRERALDEPRPPALRKMGVFLLCFLTLLTGGLFAAIWFLVQRPGLNALQSKRKQGLAATILALALLGVAAVVSVYGIVPMLSGRIDLTAIGIGLAANVVELLAWVVLIWQSLNVRRILDDHLNRHFGQKVHLSLPLTLLLLVLYLQFKINRFPGSVNASAKAVE